MTAFLTTGFNPQVCSLLNIVLAVSMLIFCPPSFAEEESSPIPLELLPRDQYDLVDWAKSVKDNIISPIGTLDGSDEVKRDEPGPLIIKSKMKVMTNVLFPHDVHTYWLDCKNCHPSIFAEKHEGTKDLSMMAIFQGKFCGRCHNKVAFRLRECYRCHMARNFKGREKEPLEGSDSKNKSLAEDEIVPSGVSHDEEVAAERAAAEKAAAEKAAARARRVFSEKAAAAKKSPYKGAWTD